MNLNRDELSSRFKDALVSATKDVFAEIEDSARANTPVLDKATSERYPGELRDSIETRVTRIKAGVKARVLMDFYGAFLELGTAKIKAQPFMWPALQEKIGSLPGVVKEKLDEK
jgi:HK97 gp10 family phage protein